MKGKLKIKFKCCRGEVKGFGEGLMGLKLVNPETQQFSEVGRKSLSRAGVAGGSPFCPESVSLALP